MQNASARITESLVGTQGTYECFGAIHSIPLNEYTVVRIVVAQLQLSPSIQKLKQSNQMLLHPDTSQLPTSIRTYQDHRKNQCYLFILNNRLTPSVKDATASKLPLSQHSDKHLAHASLTKGTSERSIGSADWIRILQSLLDCELWTLSFPSHCSFPTQWLSNPSQP